MFHNLLCRNYLCSLKFLSLWCPRHLKLFTFRLRDKANHLLNIDGDLCRKVHNAVKKFSEPFDKYLENLWCNIHNDVKFSADIKMALNKLCLLVGLHYNKPSQPVAHRWLSIYTTTATNLPMYDALYLLYYSWLSTNDKALYKMKKMIF